MRTGHDIPNARRGFTLMEMAVALSVATLLLGALGSAVVIAASALPSEAGGATESLIGASRALDRVAADLEQAVYAPERGAAAVGVVVPDRDSDGAPELIRYAWSGTDNDPLTMREDAEGAQTVLDGVGTFALRYDTVSRTDTYTGAFVANEQEVDAFPAVIAKSDALKLADGKAYARLVTPALPVGVSTWRPLRVDLYAKSDGFLIFDLDGEFTVQLRPVSGGLPSAEVLATATAEETSLNSSYSWVSVEWSDPPTLDASSSYFLVLGTTNGDSNAADLLMEKDVGTGIYKASVLSEFWAGAGATPAWSFRPTEAFLYRLHGEYETQNPDIGVTRRFVTGFSLDLTAGADPAVSLASTARALNAPEILSACWDADFSSDPTALDVNADGGADWAAADGTFNTAALVGGVWKAVEELVAAPKTNLTSPTIVDLRWRCVTMGQTGVYAFVAVDQGGGRQAVLNLWLRRRDATSQRLTLSYVPAGGGMTILADVSPESTAMLDTRLVIDPGSDSVVLILDGVEIGTYAYGTRTYAAGEHKTRIVPLGSGVEVDRVRVRMVAP